MIRMIVTAWLAALLLGGCNNDYDGENGLQSAEQATTGVQASLQSIRENVIVPESAAAAGASAAMTAAAEALAEGPDAQTLAAAQAAFETLMTAWKKTEAVYIAGKLDSSMIDVPGEMDYFHVGNEDYRAQLDAIFAGSGTLETQLFRNSHKSINALEYALFGSDHNNTALLTQMAAQSARRAQAAVIMAEALQAHLQSIADFYAADGLFVGKGDDTVEELLNQMITSAYELKEWRVGDPAGLTVSYLDDPDASRLEYADARLSLVAVRAILETHEAVMTQGLLSISIGAYAEVEGRQAAADITDALAAVDAFDGALLEDDLGSEETEVLYQRLDALFDAYYVDLINALQLSTDIIDADGD